MKKIALSILSIVLLVCACGNNASKGEAAAASKGEATEVSKGEATAEPKSEITADMAYEGVNNYCHDRYDWSVAKDNPSIMHVTMGEETDSTYRVVFRSYTGSYVYFYVNKASGQTRMEEYVPTLGITEEAGTINLFDYLKKEK